MGKGEKQPTNGPYGWGNGPQPKGCCHMDAAFRAIQHGQFRKARLHFRLGVNRILDNIAAQG